MPLKSCRCFCATMPLEKTSRVIGIVFTILNIISADFWSVKLYQLDKLEDVPVLFRNLKVLCLCGIVLRTLFSALLVAGAYKRNKHLVLSCLIFFVMYTVANTIFGLYSLYDPTVIIGLTTWDKLSRRAVEYVKVVVYAMLAVGLMLNAFCCYLAAVVYSYYKELAGSAADKEELV